ncbi:MULTISPECIES: acyl-CoA dehydrogenase family protein [Burkholderia]|uniref:acyl-CoA dehydrogenase family protein n=1 Tax=Burkholderia TaxID=32008 RepID=UPI000B7A2C0F|nr:MULTISPECIES: acyl-CoA dehydrogenase [Burkholderia]OXI95141.1 acyl-CoA dehydrogenase [Burkholderia sp. AU33803]PRD91412.1 acyl-CoA dehydrogenase [Burkholderia contaminans]
MPDALQTSQPHHDVATLKAALAASGLDLDRLCAQIRAHRDEADRTGQIPATFWQSDMVRALNLNLVPSQYGGCPGAQSLTSRVMLMEYLGHADAALALALPGPGLAMPPVLALANERQQAAFFAGFHSDAPRWGAFAITEPDCGSDATAMRTSARKTAHGWVLNGTKCFTTNGARANTIITFATINRNAGRFGIRAFCVEHDAPGFSVTRVEHMAGLRASQLAVLSYSDCEVPDDACLTHDDQAPLSDAFSGAQRSWDYFRPLLSAVMVGTCRRVRDELATYFESGSHPADLRCGPGDIDVHLLDLDRHITTAHLLCHHAAWLADQGHPSAMHASMAKAYAARVTAHVTRTALALVGLGGIAHCPSLEQCCRDAKAFDIMEGTGDMQRLMIARAAQRAPQLPWESASNELAHSVAMPRA